MPYIYNKALRELSKEENIPLTKLKNMFDNFDNYNKNVDKEELKIMKVFWGKMNQKIKKLTESGKYKIPKSNLERYSSLKSQLPEIADNLIDQRVRPLEGIDEGLEFSSSSGTSASEDSEYGIPKELNERFNPNEISALLNSIHNFLNDPDISLDAEYGTFHSYYLYVVGSLHLHND